MKLKINVIIIALTIVTYSCKKQDSTVKEKETVSPDVRIENDHLAFKDYPTFVNYYKVATNLDKDTRRKWEKSLSFKSMQTIYESFNDELDALQKLSREEYFKGFSSLKDKYAGTMLFTEDSYRLNISGLSEAVLTNKDGIVKIGDDYLKFTEKGPTTFKNIKLERVMSLDSKGVSPISATNIGAPSTNSFTSVMGEWQAIFKERGRLLFRTKAYGLHTDALGYQNFLSLEGRAEHKNIFGTWRNVSMAVGINPDSVRGYQPAVNIEYQNTTNNLPPRGSGNSVAVLRSVFDGLGNVEQFDRVLCITKGLQGNPSAALATVGASNSQLVNYSIDQKYFGNTNIFWTSASISYISFGVFIQAGSVLGNPAVFFNVFRLDSGRYLEQYQ